MGVVFDEVVSQVKSPPEQPQPHQEQVAEQLSPQDKLHCWQQQRAITQRRQQRLEAD
jgi:hypothetical protein